MFNIIEKFKNIFVKQKYDDYADMFASYANIINLESVKGSYDLSHIPDILKINTLRFNVYRVMVGDIICHITGPDIDIGIFYNEEINKWTKSSIVTECKVKNKEIVDKMATIVTLF